MLEDKASNATISAERLKELRADLALRIIVASNPATPAHLLETLARDQDAQVRQTVAGNPNTPWQTLEHLAAEFPREFLHNPIALPQILAHLEQVTDQG